MPETFRTAAAKGYQRLFNLYRQCRREHAFDGSFWHAANALHAGLDYLLRSERTDDLELLPLAQAVYRALWSPGWWRDDFGWWGNAFLLAWSNRALLGYEDARYNDLFDNFLAQSIDCAQRLNATWSDLPYGQPADHAVAGAASFPGGVYNVPPAEQAGANITLMGRNSVTNEVCWLLCQTLQDFQPGKGPSPDRMRDWFETWLSQIPGGLLDSRGVVLDRPRGLVDQPTWCWTGDQGLLFRALVNAGDSATANTIAATAFLHMADDDGILIQVHDVPGTFRIDYAVGNGVLLRHLVRPGDPPPQAPMLALIKANASAAWINRVDKYGHQFGYEWSGPFANLALYQDGTHSQTLCNLVMQASGQDALNAALLIAPDEEIPGS